MSLQDNMAAAQVVLTAAQAAEDLAKQALQKAEDDISAIQSSIDAAVPHLDFLTKIEQYAAHLPSEVVGEFNQLISDAKELFA